MSVQTKNYASELWDNLSHGLNELYEKYNNLVTQSNQEYELQIASLRPQYEGLKNNASVKAKIDDANTKQKLADQGLSVSGESLQRELLGNAALQKNLAALDGQKQAESTALQQKKQSAAASIESEKAQKGAEYLYDMNKSYFDQLNLDQQNALSAEKLRLQEIQDAFDRDLKEKELALKQQQQSFEQEIERSYLRLKQASGGSSSGSSSGSVSVSSSASSSTGTKSGPMKSYLNLTPSYNARVLVDSIVKQNTKDVYGTGTYVNKAKVKSAITTLLKNETLSQLYRYEISLYASSLDLI